MTNFTLCERQQKEGREWGGKEGEVNLEKISANYIAWWSKTQIFDTEWAFTTDALLVANLLDLPLSPSPSLSFALFDCKNIPSALIRWDNCHTKQCSKINECVAVEFSHNHLQSILCPLSLPGLMHSKWHFCGLTIAVKSERTSTAFFLALYFLILGSFFRLPIKATLNTLDIDLWRRFCLGCLPWIHLPPSLCMLIAMFEHWTVIVWWIMDLPASTHTHTEQHCLHKRLFGTHI